MKTVKYGFTAGLITTGMLINNITHAQPKVSAANRETVRIMKTIKIPPPYTPTYVPLSGKWYTLPASVTPDYSPKVGPVQPLAVLKPTTVEPFAQSFAATNTASASVTNVPVADKAVKTPASAATKEKEKARNLENYE